jgi:UDP-N-acetylmuramoyl-L-alanyl-D-glutamate--2,6-diaminopimelate ligase
VSEALRVLEELCRRGVDAQGVCTDSREVATGDVFLAMPGARTDGRAYIADALSRGAAAVVWECAVLRRSRCRRSR